MVRLLMMQQDQARTTQLLIAINVTAVLALLLSTAGGWGPLLGAAGLLTLLAWAAGPQLVRSVLQQQQQGTSANHTAGMALQQRGSWLAGSRALDRQSLRLPRGAAGGADVVSGGAAGCVWTLQPLWRGGPAPGFCAGCLTE
jgi:hypothetical protein